MSEEVRPNQQLEPDEFTLNYQKQLYESTRKAINYTLNTIVTSILFHRADESSTSGARWPVLVMFSSSKLPKKEPK